MVMEGYFAFLQASGLKRHHQIQFRVISYPWTKIHLVYSTAPAARADNIREDTEKYSAEPKKKELFLFLLILWKGLRNFRYYVPSV